MAEPVEAGLFQLALLLDTAPREYPGFGPVPNELVYLMGCRGLNQFCSTLRGLIKPDQHCPFCHTERARRAQQPTHSIGHWMLLKNEFPHRNARQMWLILPFRHITEMSELGERDWEEIGRLLNFCLKGNHIEGGGIMWRFGDPHFNVGTIAHLHINIIEPVPGQEYRPPFAKTESEHAEDYQRMLAFRDEMVVKGGMNWLFSEEGIAETQPAV